MLENEADEAIAGIGMAAGDHHSPKIGGVLQGRCTHRFTMPRYGCSLKIPPTAVPQLVDCFILNLNETSKSH